MISYDYNVYAEAPIISHAVEVTCFLDLCSCLPSSTHNTLCSDIVQRNEIQIEFFLLPYHLDKSLFCGRRNEEKRHRTELWEYFYKNDLQFSAATAFDSIHQDFIFVWYCALKLVSHFVLMLHSPQSRAERFYRYRDIYQSFVSR